MRAVERAIKIVMEKYPGYTVKEICEEKGIDIRREEMGKNYFWLYIQICMAKQ